MDKSIDVSIILPALQPTPDFLRAVYSVRAALAGSLEYELICVVRDSGNFASCTGDDLRIVQETEPGIYGAMNTALPLARGRYLYFMGQDDALLPGAREALRQGIENQADIILANVFWGSAGIYKNRASRNALVWKNWCHQGLFYDRQKFLQRVVCYPLKYKTQADHFANLVFCSASGVNISRYKGCIAWYAADGYSAQVRDEVFRTDFPDLVRTNYGFMSWAMVVLRRAILKIGQAIRGASSQ